MKKIITLGNGFIAHHLPYEISTYRIFNQDSIINCFDYYKPDMVVNTIGFCGSPNIDQCEIEKTKTYMANVVVPLIIAEECEKQGIHHVMIGSGCIFSGKSPNVVDGKDEGWNEGDFANPQSYYSKTKYACDLAIGDCKNTTILRIRMPISKKSHPRNLVNKLLKYDEIIDIQNSVTFMDDLVRCVKWTIDNGKTGIYHMTNPGTLSATEIMFSLNAVNKQYKHSFTVIGEKELGRLVKAKRSNCILNSNKLINSGFEMDSAKNLIDSYMKEYITNEH